MFLTLSQTTNLDSSKLKEFADDNFRFDKNGRKVSKRVENRKQRGKRRNCSLRAIAPFPTVFSKELCCRLIKVRACLGKGKHFFCMIVSLDEIQRKQKLFLSYLSGDGKFLARESETWFN